jgi:hypothetical protein
MSSSGPRVIATGVLLDVGTVYAMIVTGFDVALAMRTTGGRRTVAAFAGPARIELKTAAPAARRMYERMESPLRMLVTEIS